jgi:hypothetical protein
MQTCARFAVGKVIGKVMLMVPLPSTAATVEPHCAIQPPSQDGNLMYPAAPASDATKPAVVAMSLIAARTQAVVAMLVSLSLTAGVGACGSPVNVGLLVGAFALISSAARFIHAYSEAKKVGPSVMRGSCSIIGGCRA